MRVSRYFRLGRTQPTLDFVDVDITGDLQVFVDPRALRLLHSEWADECVALVQNFFQAVLRYIHRGSNNKARSLLRTLREPNETHLGLSRGRARGRALGAESASDVWEALSRSEAVRSGLLEDLEDTILMVEGISSDIISDITTNIIRGPLIGYTNQMAQLYGIPLQLSVSSGPLWDPAEREWHSTFVQLPVTTSGKLMLVPKAIVRLKMDYDVNEYYRHYLLEELREIELSANSELVQLLKNGKTRVTKKDLEAKYGRNKAMIVRETQRNPEVLRRYRRDKARGYNPPLDHSDLAATEGSPQPDWDALLQDLRAIEVGRDDATAYEHAIEALLSALFYPSLANPQLQRSIHEGRKRIDITYTNLATAGFFQWLGQHYSAPHIFIECKNYTGDPANPELDQLSGRFSPSRGQVGILVCRQINDKVLFMQRCRDTADDQRGFVIPLDDTDLEILVRERQREYGQPMFRLLREKFEELVL